MVDTIDLQKVFSPISSTAKVKGIKQRHANMQERRFEQHFQEESQKEREEKNKPETKNVDDEKGKKKHLPRGENLKGKDSHVEQEHDDAPGKLIDILT